MDSGTDTSVYSTNKTYRLIGRVDYSHTHTHTHSFKSPYVD